MFQSCMGGGNGIISPLYSSPNTAATLPRETSLSGTEIVCAPVVVLLCIPLEGEIVVLKIVICKGNATLPLLVSESGSVPGVGIDVGPSQSQPRPPHMCPVEDLLISMCVPCGGSPLRVCQQGVVTPIRAILTAKTGHLDRILRKGWSCFAFFHMLLGQMTKCACSQQSLADFQYGQMVKSHFAVQSSNKSDSQNFLDPGLSC